MLVGFLIDIRDSRALPGLLDDFVGVGLMPYRMGYPTWKEPLPCAAEPSRPGFRLGKVERE